MPSIINATTTAGVSVQGDNSGELALQTNNGTNAITIDTAQNVTFAKPISVGGNTLGAGDSSAMKNRIINGAMVIDQRNAGASYTPTGAQPYCLDRWKVDISQASKLTVQQDAGAVTPPVGFTDYLGVTSTSAYSITSSDYFVLRQAIEGFNVSDLGWGTANAKTVTLSFWVRSSLTGTFGGALLNNGVNRSYPYSYTISSANTWEYKTITITGDTTGTWLVNNGIGMFVQFGLGVGSTFSGTAGAWEGAYRFSATGATSVVGTNGATFYITGVQLEVGTQATSFEYENYTVTLQKCQRYCYKLMPGILLAKYRESDRGRINFFSMPVQMRTTVTVGSMTTTDGVSVTIGDQSDRGFNMYALATADTMAAIINTQALVTAEL
jgi:hypothetical protein